MEVILLVLIAASIGALAHLLGTALAAWILGATVGEIHFDSTQK